jgi:hypothetical protein
LRLRAPDGTLSYASGPLPEKNTERLPGFPLRAPRRRLVDFFREMSPFMLSAEAPLRERFGTDLEEKLQARVLCARARRRASSV